MGYGSRALKLLSDYFTGKLTSLDESAASALAKADSVAMATDDSEAMGLVKETISPRTHLPPLLMKLSERPPEALDYIGVSYGLTANLYKLVKYSCTVWALYQAFPIKQVLVESWFPSSIPEADTGKSGFESAICLK